MGEECCGCECCGGCEKEDRVESKPAKKDNRKKTGKKEK
jgi:hypothetical protein